MIRVLLVDDHAVMRSGFRTILEAGGDIEVVGEAATGAGAVGAASALQPDVICMDVQMPDMDGLEATRRIVADPTVRAAVIVVTTFDRDDYLFAALQAGASGFLLKNAGAAELVAAVRVVAAGDALLAPEVTRRVIERFAAAPPPAAPPDAALPSAAPPAAAPPVTDAVPLSQNRGAGPDERGFVTGEQRMAGEARWPGEALTERETEVLRLVAGARSNAEIARELYIGEATVKTHVSNVLQKLGARDRVHAAVLALRHGLG